MHNFSSSVECLFKKSVSSAAHVGKSPTLTRFSSWLRGAEKWQASATATVLESALAAASLLGCAAIFAYQVGWAASSNLVIASAAMALFSCMLETAAAIGYVYVASQSVRSSQLHMHGVVIFLMLGAIVAYSWQEATMEGGSCRPSSLALLVVNYTFWGAQKCLFFLLMKEKLTALGPPPARWADVRLWGNAVAALVAIVCALGAFGVLWALVVVLRGEASCDEVWRVASIEAVQAEVPVADKVILLLVILAILLHNAAFGVAAFGMMYAAYKATCHAVAKLEEREVLGEELTRVRRRLRHHFFGVCISIVSTLLVTATVGLFDAFNLVGEEMENTIGGASVVIDTIGDIAGILLLSGMGRLLLEEEDADAGDSSGHIRALLHSAVLTGRAEMAFEGRVAANPTNLCVASFPGKFLADWHALTWACEQGSMSSACVFLPKSNPQHRFGKHAHSGGGGSPEEKGCCWCRALYGEEKVWGCQWFQEWRANIQEAVDLQLEMVAVFFPGEAGQGVVPWSQLGQSNLWDGVGLGGSQKAEVAYLKAQGLEVTEMDLDSFRARVRTSSSARSVRSCFAETRSNTKSK